MSVAPTTDGQAGRTPRRVTRRQLSFIAVVWVALFAGAYALGAGSSSKTATASEPLAAGSRIAPSAANSSSHQTTIAALASVPATPALVKPKPKPKPAPTTATVATTSTTATTISTSSYTTPTTTTTYVAPTPAPVVPTPAPAPAPSSSGSGSSSSHTSTGTGTSSGGG
jgi:uncharacterized membrane protein YgcG